MSDDDLADLLESASKLASEVGNEQVHAKHLLAALVKRSEGPIPAVLSHVGVGKDGVLQILRSRVNETR